MADETENKPNDPNTSNNNSTVDSSQINLAKELNEVLSQVASRLEKIREITKSQADMMLNITQSFQIAQDSVTNMSNSTSAITEGIIEAAETVLEDVNPNAMQQVSKGLEEVAQSASNGLTSNSKNLTSLQESVESTAVSYSSVGENLSSVSKDLSSNASEINADILSFRENTKDLAVEANKFTEAIIALAGAIKNLFAGVGETFKNLFMGAFGLVKSVVSSIGSLVGAATQFVKFSLTVPFTIAQEAAKLGNMIRTDLVEVIQQSAEDLKESFDFDSSIGQGIQEMTARGKGMLLEFQSPSSELVKLFDMGASGIANMIKEVGTNVAAMGHFSEIFGRSIMGDERRLKNFTKMVRGFGFSSEDIHYMALDASNNLEHINVRMARLGVTLETTAKEFGVDRKRLSKNFMIMRKNITQFGHLSDEEIAATTARLTQMRIKLEDAVAVFDKFKTFEDAANSVAILSQTFGMNLDAFDMIQAKNPEEIINMFRNSMLETGRAFEDLNRFEKDLMAQHTGMSAESLAALMHYRDLGLTHQQAVDKMASERPEAKQMASLKKLNSAIKEVQKIMTFDSPFKAFADGLANNATLSGELKDVMVSLSQGYEGIYNYAKKLDPKTWEGLVKPINSIIRIMLGIFKSDAFKEGLVKTVEVISHFIGQMFNFDEPAKALQNSVFAAHNAGLELNDGVKNIAAANSKNVSVLVSLSGKIMGAIIKGAAIGFTAILKTVNDGIDVLKTKMDARNPYKNMIETFFGWDPGDVTKMGDSLRNAVTDFFSKSDGMISLTSWLLEGFGDIFDTIVGIFGGALAASIDKIFGTKFSEKPGLIMQQMSLKSSRKAPQQTMKETMSSFDGDYSHYNELRSMPKQPISKKSIASLIYDLEEKAQGVKDEKQKSQLLAKVEEFKTAFAAEGTTDYQFNTMAYQTANLMQGIQDGSYIGGDISSVANSLSLQDSEGSVIGTRAKILEELEKTAKEFDKILHQRNPGKNYKDVQSDWRHKDGSMYVKDFMLMDLEDGWNTRMRMFWHHYHKEIVENYKKSKGSWLNENTEDKFLKSPLYKEFKSIVTNNDPLLSPQITMNTTGAKGKDGLNSRDITVADELGAMSVGDLEFLNKYINISESKGILNNLLDSVSLPKMFDEETSATTVASSNYSGAKEINIDRSGRMTKQKIEEQAQKLEQIKSKLQEENTEISADFVFTKEIVDKLMKTMAKSNLVRILGMPEYTNGVMSLTETALSSRCFNIGSDGTAPTIETVQPSGS